MSYPDAKPGANPTTSKGPTPDLHGGEGSVQARTNALHSDLMRKHDQVESNAIGWRGGRENDVPQFPAKYTAADHDADTRFKMKSELASNDKFLGQVFATDEDMKYLLNKQKLNERMIFDQFYSKLWDTKDINKLRLAQQIYPDYYKDRETEINREAELQKRIAMIKLRGPADLDDIKLIYVLASGGVQLRNAPLWNLDQTNTNGGTLYQRGLFSPVRFSAATRAHAQPANLGTGMFVPDSGLIAGTTGAGLFRTNTVRDFVADMTTPQ